MRSPFQKKFYVVGCELQDGSIQLYGTFPESERAYNYDAALMVKKMLISAPLPEGSKTGWEVYKVKVEEA